MTTTDAKKLRALPCPPTFTADEVRAWNDLIVRLPLDCVPRANRGALQQYVRLAVEEHKLSRQRRPDVKRLTKLAYLLRSLSLRLNLKVLLSEGARSIDDSVAAVADDVEVSWRDPAHSRHGLMGCRVQGYGYDTPTGTTPTSTPEPEH